MSTDPPSCFICLSCYHVRTKVASKLHCKARARSWAIRTPSYMYSSYHLAAGWGPGLLEKEANARPSQWFKLKRTYCQFFSKACLHLCPAFNSRGLGPEVMVNLIQAWIDMKTTTIAPDFFYYSSRGGHRVHFHTRQRQNYRNTLLRAWRRGSTRRDVSGGEWPGAPIE